MVLSSHADIPARHAKNSPTDTGQAPAPMYPETLSDDTDAPDVTIRPLATRKACEACVRLQRAIWGRDFVDVVPATMLMVSQRVGGIAGGAFDRTDRLVGFVFGISGVREGCLAHWSDMLAVAPAYRRAGMATRLKVFQRQQLLELGITEAYWTFDPLMAVNAAFNLNRLGAVPIEYVPDMYGDTGSPLHRGLATDRLVVAWHLDKRRVERALAGMPSALPPAATGGIVITPDATLPGASLPLNDWVRLSIPRDLDELKRAAPEKAERWQRSTRHAFTWYLAHGYRVAGFHMASGAGSPWYALTTQPDRET